MRDGRQKRVDQCEVASLPAHGRWRTDGIAALAEFETFQHIGERNMRAIPLVVAAMLASQTAGAVDYAALEAVNDQINQQIMASTLPRSQPDESPSRRHAVGLDYSQPQYQYGQPVYRADQCIGAVVNGVCHGAVAPPQSINPQRCYGQMLNGQCTGPRF